MGQCICGEMIFSTAYRLPDGTIMACAEYRGCRECAPGLGSTVYFFPDDQSEWLEDVEIVPASVDEYGGNGGIGLQFDLLEIRDILTALPEVEAENGKVGPGDNDYETMADWFKDNGLRLLQKAMWHRDLRGERVEAGLKNSGLCP